MRSYPRHVRWAVPAAGVAAVAAVTVSSLISVASATPVLRPVTPGQLLAAVAGSPAPPPPLTGTVVETASLGLPDLPGLGNQNTMISLLTGSHTVKVWYGGPRQVRLAVPVPQGETDLIRNGTTAYLWQSSYNTVTRYLLPARSGHPGQPVPTPSPMGTPLTPQQAAQRALAVAGRSTTVSVDSNVSVAGQAAYQLVLAPKDGRSLIGRVSIALDGQHPQVPLRVQVFARGASSPSFQVGYTSLSFVRPAAANFTFTPPAGATTHTVSPQPPGLSRSAGPLPAALGAQVIGKNWLSVAVLPASALTGLAGKGNAASAAGQAAQSVSDGGPGPSGGAVLGALLQAATPVRGAWGSGKLLRTSLMSLLITDSGHVLAGAVTPSVLYAAAGQVK